MTPRPHIVAMTGATGFVGKASLDRALAEGHKVRALTRRPRQPRKSVTWIAGSLGDAASLETLCDGADVALHIAGVVNAPDKAGFRAGNVAGTQAMIDAAKAAGVRRFVHVSSLAAREPKLSDYGMSKYRAEKAVATSMLDWTIVRPPAVYGPGDTEFVDMFRMAARGVMLLPPRGKLSLIHVEDMARLLIAVLDPREDLTAETFEADDGEPGDWTYRSFARAVGQAMGRRVETASLPASLLLAAGYTDRFLRRSNAKLTPDRARYMAHPDWTSDDTKRPPADLWTPQIGTRQGLKDTARWYRGQGWLR